MQLAEITRTETSERARLLRVESYDVELDLTLSQRHFRSRSVIRFECAEPGAQTYVDLAADTVHEIALNGAPIDPAAAYAEGRITLTGLAASNELRVAADCAFSTDGTGLHRAVDSADGRVYCYTHFEPADARKVFANFEQPDLKASFSFHITAPANWLVLSNQPAPEPEHQGADPHSTPAATWHFAATPRISTYLTAIVAGEYHLVSDSHTTPGGQVIPLGLACRQSLAPYLEPDDMLGITRQGLDYYTRLFQGPFPFAKYDQVLVPEFPAGAMENVGCVTFSENSLFRSKVTDARYEQRATEILHEMAHMWFGNLVTMRWWDDLWLNESFAEMCAVQSCAEATRFADAWTTFCSGRKVWGYMQDQQPSTHPIAADVPTLSEAIANFDGISYAKGGSVLKQLVAYAGRDNFFAAIRAYLAEHAWGNATLADLLSALEESSGRSLADWSKAWLETAGPNTLRSEFAVDADGRFADFAVLQEAPPEQPTLRPHHIAIGLYSRQDGAALVRTHRVETDVAGARTAVPELAGLPRPDLILLNDDDLGYAIVRFDDRSLRTLTTSIGEFADSLARTVCWSAVLDMALQAEISLPAFARIVAAGMGYEPSISVLQFLLGLTSELVMLTADPSQLAELQQTLADAAMPLLQSAEPGSDHQLAWAQLLAATAVTPAQLDLLAGLLAGNAEVPGLAVDTELRWALLRRLATTGRAADAEIDAELARDNTDEGRRHAASCRASVPDAAHKEAAWRLLAESDALGTEGVIEVARGFGQVDHAVLIAPYAERYFEVLPDIWTSKGDQFKFLLATLLFPYAAASHALLDRIDAFLAAGDRNPGMARVLIQGRDTVEKALRARALPS
jgi:aminopeptidase N